MGKNQSNIPIHAKGGKAEAIVLKIELSDEATPNDGNSTLAILKISGINAATGVNIASNNKWVATFISYYDSNRPSTYKIEISWDGKWHNRLTEMLQHSVKIKELKK